MFKKICWNLSSFFISLLPLRFIRLFGAYGALFAISLSKNTKKRLLNNITKTKICDAAVADKFASNTLKHLGMTLSESAYIVWCRNKKRVIDMVESEEGFALVEKYLAEKQPIVFITPHIGNFEVAVKYFYYRFPSLDLTVIYKPNKDTFIEKIVFDGREEDRAHFVKTNRSGVVSLVRALRDNKAIGILPDNVASSGDGAWVDFFGVPVYATTLAAKMILLEMKPKAILISSVRTKKGLKIKAEEIIPESYTDYLVVMKQIYTKIEELVSKHPEQFYWSYDRFRVPKGAKNA